MAICGALFFKTPITRKIIFALCLTFLGLWSVFSQEVGGPAQTSIMGALGPFFTIALAVYILDEIFKLYHTIGFILNIKKTKPSDSIIRFC